MWINDGCEGTALTTPAPPYQGGEQGEVKETCIRRDLVEKALDEIGVTYRIVTDKKEFQTEIRNNLYTDYLILGNFNPMEDGYVSELRERVFSGRGLVSSLWHTRRIDEDMFGISKASQLSGKNYPLDRWLPVNRSDYRHLRESRKDRWSWRSKHPRLDDRSYKERDKQISCNNK